VVLGQDSLLGITWSEVRRATVRCRAGWSRGSFSYAATPAPVCRLELAACTRYDHPMKKVFTAAVSGVLFGAVLGISIYRAAQEPAGTIEATPIEVVIVSAPPATGLLPASRPGYLKASDDGSREPGSCGKNLRTMTFVNDDARLTAAQIELVNGHYHDAITLAASAVEQSPLRAYRIMGAAACQLRDPAGATTAYQHSEAIGRQYLRYVCQHNGISFQHGHFTRSLVF